MTPLLKPATPAVVARNVATLCGTSLIVGESILFHSYSAVVVTPNCVDLIMQFRAVILITI
jgi:hypothetical protein